MNETFRIVRFFQNERVTGRHRDVIQHGLTLEEAQAHCRDPETSSTTCRKSENVRRTEKCGEWFDGYEREP